MRTALARSGSRRLMLGRSRGDFLLYRVGSPATALAAAAFDRATDTATFGYGPCMSDAHPPQSDAPETMVALDSDAVVRDVAGGTAMAPGAWIAERMRAQDRTQDECREELLNAIARGDVVVVRAGDASDR